MENQLHEDACIAEPSDGDDSSQTHVKCHTNRKLIVQTECSVEVTSEYYSIPGCSSHETTNQIEVNETACSFIDDANSRGLSEAHNAHESDVTKTTANDSEASNSTPPSTNQSGAPRLNPLNAFLLRISNDIRSDELKSMKFLVTDNMSDNIKNKDAVIIERGVVENLHSATDLLAALHDRIPDDEKYLVFLIDIFKYIKNIKIANKVEAFRNESIRPSNVNLLERQAKLMSLDDQAEESIPPSNVNLLARQAKFMSLDDQAEGMSLIATLPDDATNRHIITSKKTLYMTSHHNVICDDAGNSKIVQIALHHWLPIIAIRDVVTKKYKEYVVNSPPSPDVHVFGKTYIRVGTWARKAVVSCLALDKPGDVVNQCGVCFTYKIWLDFIEYLVAYRTMQAL